MEDSNIAHYVAPALIGLWYLGKWLFSSKNNDNQDTHEESYQTPETTNNNKLAMEQHVEYVTGLLASIGCLPEVKDPNEPNTVAFEYQGEHFTMCVEEGPLVTIYDAWWSTLDLNDPNVEALKEAINNVNVGRYIPKVVYTILEEQGVLGIHTTCRTLLCQEVPNSVEYMKFLLRSFFEIQREVHSQFDYITLRQHEHPKERPVIKGFGEQPAPAQENVGQ